MLSGLARTRIRETGKVIKYLTCKNSKEYVLITLYVDKQLGN